MSRDTTADRLHQHVQTIHRQFPHGFSDLLDWRSGRDLPDWLFVPLDAGIHAVRAEELRQQRPETAARRLYILTHAPVVTMLGTWRISRGVYEFAPELLTALWSTPLKGEIPAQVLQGLPEFAPYLVLPEGVTYLGQALPGVWASLDQRPDGTPWLRLLLDMDTPERLPLLNLSLPLQGTLDQALEAMQGRALDNWAAGIELGGLEDEAAKQAALGVNLDERQLWQGVISLLLYLCNRHADYPTATRPQRATAKDVRRSLHPQAQEVKRWVLGHRTAQAIREARQPPAGTATGREMPTHWRNPRWTVVWTGKGKETPEVRWEPGLLVRADRFDEEHRVVVHPVKRNQGGLTKHTQKHAK